MEEDLGGDGKMRNCKKDGQKHVFKPTFTDRDTYQCILCGFKIDLTDLYD